MDDVQHYLESFRPYIGYIVAFAGLASILLVNQLIYKSRWKNYPTRQQYLAANPGCYRADGILCNRCDRPVLPIRVSGKGIVFRCSWCEDELFRVDKT